MPPTVPASLAISSPTSNPSSPSPILATYTRNHPSSTSPGPSGPHSNRTPHFAPPHRHSRNTSPRYTIRHTTSLKQPWFRTSTTRTLRSCLSVSASTYASVWLWLRSAISPKHVALASGLRGTIVSVSSDRCALPNGSPHQLSFSARKWATRAVRVMCRIAWSFEGESGRLRWWKSSGWLLSPVMWKGVRERARRCASAWICLQVPRIARLCESGMCRSGTRSKRWNWR